MAKTRAKSKTSRTRGRTKAPAAKHVTVAPEQPLHVHVTHGSKELSHHIVQGLEDGTLRTVVAPAEAPPVQDPNPVSGT